MSLKKIFFVLLSTFFLLASPASAEGPGKLVLIIADHLSIYDLANYHLPNMQRILKRGSVALLNTNTAGKIIPENTYLTIAAGSRSLGSSWSGRAFNYAETGAAFATEKKPLTTAEVLQGIGIPQIKSGEISHLGIYQLQNTASRLKYSVEIGALGELLQTTGLTTYILGNADTYAEPRRFAALLTVNRQGFAGNGQIGREILTKDDTFPFGWRTDYEKIYSYFSKALPYADFIVLETGDLSRLEEYQPLISAENFKQQREQALRRLDYLLGRVASSLKQDRDLLILASPTPGKEELARHNNLTPVIMYGKGVQAGLLTSPSTRREGIVVNTDLAPTIAAFFGLNTPAAFVGRPVISHSSENNLNFLLRLNTRLIEIYNHRPVILKSHIVMQILFILSAIALLILTTKELITRIISFFVFYFLISTLLLIFFGYFQTARPALSLVIFLGLGLAVSALVYALPFNGLKKIQAVALLTSLVLLFDLLFKLGIMQNSPLGYDPIIGARYYGLGNELAGVLIGSTLLSASLFWQENRGYLRLLGAAYLILTAAAIFLPQYGADVGGLITATLSFGYLLLNLKQKKSPARLALILPLAAALLLFAVAAADFYLNKNDYTHMALTVSTIKQEGLNEAFNIISRKVNMNIKLLNYSIWTKALLSFLLAFAILLAWPKGFVLRLKTHNPILYQAFAAILIASIVGLLVNDSGIIQAATTFIYLIFPLLYLAKNETT
ncbi:hypothetical protein [Zhaonella formicivorans]|uniref:hypothetical protein n=1 Tax=Zhaonella formicivorans TaxID=2528593 RepID=UPI001D0F988D|nr:hypothetical protein [Zhaonella formicivorans]